MKTVGIYGGSFDPIHSGHAALASWLSQVGVVDEVWLMVSRLNPLKEGTQPAADADRLAMARLVAERCPRVVASDFELHRPVPSYTYETLCALSEQHPDCRFRLIIGADNWQQFDRWRNHDKLLRDFAPIVCPRPSYPLPSASDRSEDAEDSSRHREMPEGVDVMADAPLMEISSTEVRQWLAEGRDVAYLVPTEVLDYIKQRNLYT